jgi:chloramphenicol-sensitive protein RarD
MSSSLTRGTWLAAASYVLWGLLPLYWKALESAGPELVLAHRIIWALVFTTALVLIFRLLPEIRQAFSRAANVWRMIAGAALISANWWLYIWAIDAGYVVEAALGYYINPLINVLFGVVFLKERLNRFQIAALSLAAVGVLVLLFGLGKFPIVAFGLALTFGAYGLLKKRSSLTALTSLQLETLFSLPLSVVLLIWGAHGSQPSPWWQPWLLVLAGPMTAVPLWLFGAGAKLIPLTRLGFLQYLSPTITLLIGLFVFGETFDGWHAAAFSCIWLALVVFTFDSVRRARA